VASRRVLVVSTLDTDRRRAGLLSAGLGARTSATTEAAGARPPHIVPPPRLAMDPPRRPFYAPLYRRPRR
jgi:hypothetical protein